MSMKKSGQDLKAHPDLEGKLDLKDQQGKTARTGFRDLSDEGVLRPEGYRI